METPPIQHDRVVTSPFEADQARAVLHNLRGASGALAVEQGGRRVAELPVEIGRVLQQVLDAVASGRPVTVAAMPDELTTSMAADVLRISRPTLMKLIRDGEIHAYKVGTHHRLKATDVLALRKERRAQQRAAFDALRELDDRTG